MRESGSFLAYAKVTSVVSSQLLFLNSRKVNVDTPCCLFFPSSIPRHIGTSGARRGLWKLTVTVITVTCSVTGRLSSDLVREAKLTCWNFTVTSC